MKKAVNLIILFTAGFALCSAAEIKLPSPSGTEAKAVVSLVRGAASLVSEKGETAFAALQDDSGPWKKGELNIVVISTNGVIVSAAQGAALGLSTAQINYAVTNTALTPGETWLFSVNPQMQPGKSKTENIKSWYAKQVTAPGGAAYIIMAGLYNLSPERAFAVKIVKDASALLIKEGLENAFSLIRGNSELYTYGDIYVFVLNPDGHELFDYAFPSNENKDLSSLRDTNGKLMVRDIINTASGQNEGWVTYTWPKPGSSQPSAKEVFVKKTQISDDSWVITAAGLYTDILTK